MSTQIIFKDETFTAVGTYYFPLQNPTGDQKVYRITAANLQKFLVKNNTPNSIGTDITVDDTYYIGFGTGNDFQISHDSSDTSLENTTGDLSLKNLNNNSLLTLSAKSASNTINVVFDPTVPEIQITGARVSFVRQTQLINNTASYTTDIPSNLVGHFKIRYNDGTERGADFICNFTAGNITREHGDATYWNNTQGNPGTTNVYFNGGFIEVENRSGGNLTYRWGWMEP